jgi:hypothetical protein
MGKILNVDAYPCYWPEGWEQTPPEKRRPSKYTVEFGRARDEIVRQLKVMAACEVVISTNVPVRRDGQRLASASEPKDPAVAVYWAELGPRNGAAQPGYKHRVIACDRWLKVRENLHAINKSLEALRALSRAGATQVVEKAFTGFTALAAENPRRSWREVFVWLPSAVVDRATIEARFRQLAAECHPDRGGCHEDFVELSAAREQALAELERLEVRP